MLSIPMHMQNLHVFPDNESFVQCSHLALPQTGRDKKWLQPGSLVSTKPYHYFRTSISYVVDPDPVWEKVIFW